MENKIIRKVIQSIKTQIQGCVVPSVTVVSFHHDPYLVLISCILSLRTKDKTTVEASQRLFSVAKSPRKMLELTARQIQKIIYPVGFYRTKAKVVIGVSRKILQDYKGKVPRKLEELLSFKGVGRKTANLVLGLGFHIPAICVDTHVHRISNRLGWVHTRDPEHTEEALKILIPTELWIDLNTVLVTFGQNICLPVSAWCSRCSVYRYCERVGVIQSR